MATKIYFRRGTKVELDQIVLESGEPAWTEDTKELYMGDGTTSGGIFVAGSGLDVDSLNALTGIVTISGKAGVTVEEVGQVIVVSGNLGQIENFLINDFEYPAPGTDWTPILEGAYLNASGMSKKCWLPVDFLKEGDEIVSYRLVGDAVEETAVTLDCKLVRISKADPLTTAVIGGGVITQVNTDGNFDNLATLSGAEVIATDKQYKLELLGTTDALDAITVIGAEVQARIN